MSELATWLKEFLYDRTIYAVASIAFVAVVYLMRQWRAEAKARIEDLKQILPLADKMVDASTEMAALLDKLSARRKPGV